MVNTFLPSRKATSADSATAVASSTCKLCRSTESEVVLQKRKDFEMKIFVHSNDHQMTRRTKAQNNKALAKTSL